MQQMMQQLKECVRLVRDATDLVPEMGLVLGSGLGFLADRITDPVKFPYDRLPGFPVSTVPGHAGQLVLGRLASRPVAVMQGRFHYYEGVPIERVGMGVRLMGLLGARAVLITNAAGGIRPGLDRGSLMLISDHINMMGVNPLIGPNLDELGVRFPDLSDAYTRWLREQARRIAASLSIDLQEGVYVASSGPSYESPAEILAFARLGADAVGMSTVPEVVTAAHMGLKVLGISCISNLAAGMTDEPLSHDEVTETAGRVRDVFSRLVLGLVEQLRLDSPAKE
jgi:purine-nucleoside phosphorylase